jgi:hypothetical protein
MYSALLAVTWYVLKVKGENCEQYCVQAHYKQHCFNALCETPYYFMFHIPLTV